MEVAGQDQFGLVGRDFHSEDRFELEQFGELQFGFVVRAACSGPWRGRWSWRYRIVRLSWTSRARVASRRFCKPSRMPSDSSVDLLFRSSIGFLRVLVRRDVRRCKSFSRQRSRCSDRSNSLISAGELAVGHRPARFEWLRAAGLVARFRRSGELGFLVYLVVVQHDLLVLQHAHDVDGQRGRRHDAARVRIGNFQFGAQVNPRRSAGRALFPS